MLTLDILGPTRNFGWFQDGRHEKRRNAYITNYSYLFKSLLILEICQHYFILGVFYLSQSHHLHNNG